MSVGLFLLFLSKLIGIFLRFKILDTTFKWYHVIFMFLWLTPLSVIVSRPIYVAANASRSFFFMAEQSCLLPRRGLCDHMILGWPKSFKFVCKMLQTNPNKFFGQPDSFFSFLKELHSSCISFRSHRLCRRVLWACFYWLIFLLNL